MTSFLYFLPVIFLSTAVMLRFYWQSRGIHPVMKSRRRINLKNIALLAIILPYITSCIILYSGSKKSVLHFKLEGFKFSLHYKKKKPQLPKCGKCGISLKGVLRARSKELQKTAKTKKRPERPFPNLCSKCMRKKIIEVTRNV